MPVKKRNPSVSMQLVRQPVEPRQDASEPDRAQDQWPASNDASPEAAAAGNLSWGPKVDVFERGRQLITRVDLPGVRAQQIRVVVTDDHLVISGRRQKEPEASQDRYWRSERDHGAFHRAVPLPKGIQPEDVTATFGGGVLEVCVPLPIRRATKVTRVPIAQARRSDTAG